MRPFHFMLGERGDVVPVPLNNTRTWAEWFESSHWVRSMARSYVHGLTGRMFVSTVFLGLDHNFTREGPPVLWETMVFGGHLDGEGARYSSREEAEIGHATLVALCETTAKDPIIAWTWAFRELRNMCSKLLDRLRHRRIRSRNANRS